MLPTSPLDRAPFPEICQMFRGELAPKDLLEKVETSPNDANKSLRLFNAHLYVGIYHDLHGETKESLRLLRLAVNDPRPAAFGQAYMHRLARCHYEMLLAAERK